MNRRCAMVFLIFTLTGGCVAGHADVKQAGTGDARSASPDTGTVRAGGDIDTRLDGLRASIDGLEASLGKVQTDVTANLTAARDAISKQTTTNGVTGWHLVAGMAVYFLISKGTDLLAIWRRLPGKGGGNDSHLV